MKAIGTLFSYVCLMLFASFALSVMWGWFVVPLGVMSIGYAHALGLSLVVSLFVGNTGASQKDRTVADLIILGFIRIGVVFLFGYIIQLFM